MSEVEDVTRKGKATMLDKFFDLFNLMPDLTPQQLIAVVERHLAEYAAQISQKEAQMHTLFSGAIDAKHAGDAAAEETSPQHPLQIRPVTSADL
jgi:hypothetical protein